MKANRSLKIAGRVENPNLTIPRFHALRRVFDRALFGISFYKERRDTIAFQTLPAATVRTDFDDRHGH